MTPTNTNGLNRRSFLKSTAGLGGLWLAAGAPLSLASPSRGPAPWVEQMGVQLYTVRSLMESDFEGTVEKVAEIGYKEVEFAGYYDRSAEQVRALLDRLGLTAPSTHVGLEQLREDLEGQLDTAATIGHRYVTIPALPGAFGGQIEADAWPGFAEEFNQIGTACNERGLKLAYHNHAFEFAPAGDSNGFEILLAGTDPDLVAFEMDLMWTVFAGQDPLAWFEAYPGRFVLWHVKDMKDIDAVREAASQGPGGFRAIMENIAAVGEGEIDFASIFAQAEQSGLEHFFVENDAPQEPLANIQSSYTNLSQMLAQG